MSRASIIAIQSPRNNWRNSFPVRSFGCGGTSTALAIYEEASMAGGVTAFGRCIGHGGMPVDLPPKTPLHDFAVEFVDERLYPNDENLVVGYNGFAKMTLRDDQLTLDYVDVRGTRVFSETWTVDQGKLVRLKARRG